MRFGKVFTASSRRVDPPPMVVTLEPNMVGYLDHYYNYNLGLAKQASAHGYKFKCFANLRLENVESYVSPGEIFVVKKWFRYKSFETDIFRAVPIPRSIRLIASQLIMVLNLSSRLLALAADLPAQSCMLMTAVKPYQVVALYLFLRLHRKPMRLSLVFNTGELFDQNHLRRRWTRLAAAVGTKALRRMVRHPGRHTVTVSADSTGIARALEAALGFAPDAVGIAPIPAMSDNPSQDQARRPQGRPLAFGYLGSARNEKGFALFVATVAVVVAFGLVPDCNFVVQLALDAGAAQADMDAVRRARELSTKYPSVRCIEGELDPENFAAVMRSVDVLVLPYDDRSYLYRTSGMLADALAVGKVVIVPDDTWMADQVSRLGSGVIFPMGEVAGLCKAIVGAAENFDRLSAAATQGAGIWAAANNPGALFEHLFLSGVAQSAVQTI